jgi:phosphorylcholine metabolism protein LicD
MSMNRGKETEYVCPVCQPGKPALTRTMITDTTLADFEGLQFPVSIDHDKYLSRYYQTPLELPPEEKRHPTHGIVEIKL